MGVTREEVRHVAALARLNLDEAEVAALTRDLSEILQHVDALAGAEEGLERADGGEASDGEERDAADVGDAGDAVAPPVVRGGPLRADEPGADPLVAAPSEFAPQWEEGLFVVPRLASHEDDGTGRELASDP